MNSPLMISPLMIVFEEGEARPYFRCEKCDKPITDAEDALVQWDRDARQQNVACTAHVLHKNCAPHVPGTPWEELGRSITSLLKHTRYNAKSPRATPYGAH